MMLSKFSRLMGRGRGPYCLHTIFPQTLSSSERLFVSSVHHETVNSVSSNAKISHDNCSHQRLHSMAFSTKLGRRRRRGAVGGTPHHPARYDDDSNGNSPTSPSSVSRSPALSSEQFVSVSNSLLDRVESAVTELKDCNDGLEITRYPPASASSGSMDDNEEEDDGDLNYRQHGGRLSIQVESSGDLYWGGGTYWITVLPDNAENISGGTIILQSPLSGSFTYVYNASSGEWVGSEDGHSLLGMFTRDWIRQCRGVPDF